MFFLAKFGTDDHWGLQRLHQADTPKPLGDENTFSLGVPRGEHFINIAELREWVRVPEAGVIVKERVSICSQVGQTQEGAGVWGEAIAWVESY